jgi:hypothetical protein
MPIPSTDAQSLDDLIALLARHAAMDGIVLIGTTGTAALTPTSDYDLLLIFEVLPAPLRIVTTWLGERLTEVYCTTRLAVERVAAHASSWPDDSEEGTLVTWLRDGRIAYDRDGSVATAQERVRREPQPALATDRKMYEARRKIAYNVVQLERYLSADDSVSAVAVDLRLLYSVFEVALHYFTVRRLPWRGEKPAVRYWTENDPQFLDLLRRCLAAPDRKHKAALYKELASRALAPVGGLWERGSTFVAVGSPWGAGSADAAFGDLDDALGFWRQIAAGAFE